jgi:hypothetical protein
VIGLIAAVVVVAFSSVAGATVMTYMDLETLVSESDVIVRGEVAEMQMVTDDRGTFRHTTVEVDTTYLGESRDEVTLEQWR